MSNSGSDSKPITGFHGWISKDPRADFFAERNRYHLFVSLACPYAIRTLVVRELKGLESVVGCTVVDWHLRRPEGWNFTTEKTKCSAEPFFGCKYLSELYYKADPTYAGRFTVPMLWDKRKQTIVNNESSEIIEIFNSQFDDYSATMKQTQLDLYPKRWKLEIDAFNEEVDTKYIANLYTCGYTTDQEQYDRSVLALFEMLDSLDKLLSKQRFLVGKQLTLADVRLFSHLVGFDWVYHSLYRCNKKRLIDYPHLWAFVRDIYNMYSVCEVINREHIVMCNYSQPNLNPSGIVPIGPTLDFYELPGREHLP